MVSDFDFVKGQIKVAYREAEDNRTPNEEALHLTAKYFFEEVQCDDIYGEGLEAQAVEILVFCEYFQSLEALPRRESE